MKKDLEIPNEDCNKLSLLLLELKNIMNLNDEDKIALTMFREYEKVDTFKAMIEYVKDDNVEIRQHRINVIKKELQQSTDFMIAILNLSGEIFTEYENRLELLRRMELHQQSWNKISYEKIMTSQERILKVLENRIEASKTRKTEPYFNKKKFKKYILEHKTEVWHKIIQRRKEGLNRYYGNKIPK